MQTTTKKTTQKAAPAKDNKVEVSKRNRYHYCNDWDPEYFKSMAKECRDRAHRSFENSDTDGFMSQWANEEMARRYDHAAAIARDGHMKGKRVVLDLDGNIISDDERKNEYGYYWFIPSREGKDRFFNASKALNEKTAIRNDAKKGCVLGYAIHHVTMNNSGDVEYGEFSHLDEETMDALQAARDAVA